MHTGLQFVCVAMGITFLPRMDRRWCHSLQSSQQRTPTDDAPFCLLNRTNDLLHEEPSTAASVRSVRTGQPKRIAEPSFKLLSFLGETSRTILHNFSNGRSCARNQVSSFHSSAQA